MSESRGLYPNKKIKLMTQSTVEQTTNTIEPTSAASANPPFMLLPNEIHTRIREFLDYTSISKLNCTNSLFHNSADNDSYKAELLLTCAYDADYQEAESFLKDQRGDIIFKKVKINHDQFGPSISPLRYALKVYDLNLLGIFFAKIMRDPELLALFHEECAKKIEHINLQPLLNAYDRYNAKNNEVEDIDAEDFDEEEFEIISDSDEESDESDDEENLLDYDEALETLAINLEAKTEVNPALLNLAAAQLLLPWNILREICSDKILILEENYQHLHNRYEITFPRYSSCDVFSKPIKGEIVTLTPKNRLELSRDGGAVLTYFTRNDLGKISGKIATLMKKYSGLNIVDESKSYLLSLLESHVKCFANLKRNLYANVIWNAALTNNVDDVKFILSLARDEKNALTEQFKDNFSKNVTDQLMEMISIELFLAMYAAEGFCSQENYDSIPLALFQDNKDIIKHIINYIIPYIFQKAANKTLSVEELTTFAASNQDERFKAMIFVVKCEAPFIHNYTNYIENFYQFGSGFFIQAAKNGEVYLKNPSEEKPPIFKSEAKPGFKGIANAHTQLFRPFTSKNEETSPGCALERSNESTYGI